MSSNQLKALNIPPMAALIPAETVNITKNTTNSNIEDAHEPKISPFQNESVMR